MAYYGLPSSSIEAREAEAVEDMKKGVGQVKYVALPIEEKDPVQVKLEELGVTFGPRRDKVLVNCQLPTGWSIVPNGPDPRHQYLRDADQKNVAYVFLKNSGYDYYGHVSMI